MIGSGIGSVTHLCRTSIQCATESRRGVGRGKLSPVQMWQGYLVGLGDVPACDPQHDTHHSPRWRGSADDRAQPDYRWDEDRSPRPPHSHLQSGCQPGICSAADTAAERGRLR